MKKKDIKIITIIVIVLIGVGIFILTKQKDTPNKLNEEVEQEEQTEEYSLIDMNNTENVKIEGDVKENNSEALLEEKTQLGMKISNIRLVAENGLTTFTADVENTSEKDFKEREIVIVFKNQDGSEYARLNGFLPDIPKGESSRIDSSITDDLSNAYDFVIE